MMTTLVQAGMRTRIDAPRDEVGSYAIDLLFAPAQLEPYQ